MSVTSNHGVTGAAGAPARTDPEDSPAASEGVPGPARFSGRRLRELVADDAWLDELIDRADEGGVELTGPGGFLPEMIKAVLERGLAAELTDHLGYEHGDPAGRGSPNSRKRHLAQDGADRGRRRGAGRATGPQQQLRLAPGAQGRTAPGRPGRHDHLAYAGGMTMRDIRRTRAALEVAVIECIDWYEAHRLHGESGDIPPFDDKPTDTVTRPRR